MGEPTEINVFKLVVHSVNTVRWAFKRKPIHLLSDIADQKLKFC